MLDFSGQKFPWKARYTAYRFSSGFRKGFSPHRSKVLLRDGETGAGNQTGVSP